MSEKKPHILLLPSWYLPEGGQFCRNQAQALCEKGIKANILANVSISIKKYKSKYFTFQWKSFSSNEDSLIVYRNYFRHIPLLNKTNGLLWSWQTVRLFKKYCTKYGKPDVIHVHSVLWGGYAAYLIKKKFNIPYIITEHKGVFGLSCQYAINQFQEWQTPYFEKSFSNAKVIIPVSNKQIPKIQSYLKKNVLIQHISNVVDTDFFYYKKRKIENEIHFVAINGFSFVKAYDILLPAFDRACDKVSNINLRIAGEDFEGEAFDKLWNEVKHKDKIIFTGELDMHGVRDELWKANIYVISSRVEAQPVSTIEALSTGLPIICTSVVPDELACISNSLKVPVENIEALSEAIIEMSKKVLNYDGETISNQIKLIASKEVVTRNLIELYSNIIL